jgi:hypothetical protein
MVPNSSNRSLSLVGIFYGFCDQNHHRTSFQGRNTAQGLLGLHLQPHAAVLAELNCETDFVAKNKKFVRQTVKLVFAFVSSVFFGCYNISCFFFKIKFCPLPMMIGFFLD